MLLGMARYLLLAAFALFLMVLWQQLRREKDD